MLWHSLLSYLAFPPFLFFFHDHRRRFFLFRTQRCLDPKFRAFVVGPAVQSFVDRLGFFLRLFTIFALRHFNGVFFEASQSPQRGGHFLHALEPIGWILGQHLQDDLVQLRCNVGITDGQWKRIFGEMLLQKIFRRRAGKGRVPREHLVKSHSQAVHVCPLIRRLLQNGFRGDICPGPLNYLRLPRQGFCPTALHA